MLRKLLSIILITVVLPSNSYAQDWVKKMQDPTVNFYDVQQSFNDYWKKEEQKEKFKSFFTFRNKTEKENEGYVMYKRWEQYIEPRVFPSGDRSLIHAGNEVRQKMISNPAYKSSMLVGGNWSPLGAFGVPTDGGAGRLNCIAFHPGNPAIIFVGAPSGGLWKTSNGGTTWTTTTDLLPTLGVSDIVINPVNTNIMYMGTGDMDGSDSYGVGVLKSTDAGGTWNITGLNWNTSQGRDVNRMLISPNDENLIFAGTSTGVFRSADAGITWMKTLGVSNIKDMEFKPGDPSVIYAASLAGIYKSVNSGLTFTLIPTSAGLPVSSSINRIAIAVSAADPDYIYALYSASSDSGFKGLYLSTNSGSSFSMQSNSPNLIGYDYDGSDAGGNGWYTLSLAVSPSNASEVMVGGVNVWKSSDAGSSWACIAHWWGAGGLPYVHADIHNLIYRPDGLEFFAACDGGIFKTTNGGSSWTDKSGGLQIGEMYRLGNSVTNASVVIQGWQDNGCNLYDAGAFDRVLGGDGMECFIDWSNPNYVYGEYQNGGLQRSSNGGASFSDIVNNITESGQWITPWMQDPVTPNTLYAGFDNVWKSTNRGNSWTAISSFGALGLTILEVAKTNPLYIYAGNSSTIRKTTDGGTTWTTLALPMPGSSITALEISTTNPNMIWISRSGYTATNKVHKSVDGGITWTNMSASLPNIPINCILNQTGTNEGVYVGTDVGVYYTDNDLTSWMPFSNGLPNVVVDELEIHYGAGKLRAATFGRGLWETTIHDPSSNLPYANFTGDTLSGCPGFNVQYSDSTTNSPTSWSWTFPGGTPASSNLQNPVVAYNTPGMYHNVKLIVTNTFGTDSVTKYSYIAVSPQTIPLVSLSKNDTICQGTSLTLASSNGSTYLWHPTNQSSQTIGVTTTGTYSVTVTDAFGCKQTSDSVKIYVAPLPVVPVITMSNDTLFSSYSSGNQWYNSGVLIAGATDSLYVLPTWGLNITVRQTDSITGCYSTSVAFVGVDELSTNGISYSVFPNPGNGMISLVFQTGLTGDVAVEITDMIGRSVYEKRYDSFKGRQESSIDLSSFGRGIYLLSLKNAKGIASRKVVVY
jgi:PKD repeat protein